MKNNDRIVVSGGDIANRNELTFKPASKKRREKKSIKFYKIMLILFALFIVIAVILKFVEMRLQPIIKSMAVSNARSLASRVVSESINEEIEKENLMYDDLITFEKNDAGSITALKTNIIILNKLKSKLAVLILNKLSDIDNMNLYIPVGNIINGELFSGRGPKIEVRLLPIGSVVTDISNVFESAGINQTKHQIMLDVSVMVSVIMPFNVESIDLSSSICIAETVIVGDVPQMYMESGNKSDILK